MKKTIIFFLLVLVLSGILFWGGELYEFYSKMVFDLPQIKQDIPALAREFRYRISAPGPLVVDVRQPESFLTRAGIIELTNAQRIDRGLPILKENAKLNSSALMKAQDMINLQYFGHISPLGQGVGDLAESAGYEIIAIGENLALGDFENDQVLVQAWMDSPGHRANILNSQYQEIGVAVMKGEYQGRLTWLAVQHFGKPLSSCREPSKNILAEIGQNQEQIEKLRSVLSELETAISDFRPKRGPEYNQKVQEYNAMVLEYNVLIDETKALIEQYNAQVKLFNQCAQGP